MTNRNRKRRTVQRERGLMLASETAAVREIRRAAYKNCTPESRLMAAIFGLNSPIGIEQGRIPQ